jgi:hypothetical protein
VYSRALRIAILLFQAVWLNIIVPGHTRGIVAFPSGSGAQPACPACAPPSACLCCGGRAPAKPPKDPTPADRANCAICQFMAHLSLPPLYDYRPAALQLLELLPISQPPSRVSAVLIDSAHCHGPPENLSGRWA